MLRTVTVFISLIAIALYIYRKSKSDLATIVLFQTAFLLMSLNMLTSSIEEFRTGDPYYNSILALIIVSSPSLGLLIPVAIKLKKSNNQEEKQQILGIFKATRHNILFWLCIVFINFLAFLADNYFFGVCT